MAEQGFRELITQYAMISAKTAGAWNDAQSLIDHRLKPQGMQQQLSEESQQTQ